MPIRTINLSEPQNEALAWAARDQEVSKSIIVDRILAGYLRRAFEINYEPSERSNPGDRRKGNSTGMHSFVFSPEQADALHEATTIGDMSFAQLFEAAASDQFPILFGRGWPARHRASLPFGRPPSQQIA